MHIPSTIICCQVAWFEMSMSISISNVNADVKRSFIWCPLCSNNDQFWQDWHVVYHFGLYGCERARGRRRRGNRRTNEGRGRRWRRQRGFRRRNKWDGWNWIFGEYREKVLFHFICCSLSSTTFIFLHTSWKMFLFFENFIIFNLFTKEIFFSFLCSQLFQPVFKVLLLYFHHCR